MNTHNIPAALACTLLALFVFLLASLPGRADEIELPDGTVEPAICLQTNQKTICESRLAICTMWEYFLRCELKPIKN